MHTIAEIIAHIKSKRAEQEAQAESSERDAEKHEALAASLRATAMSARSNVADLTAALSRLGSVEPLPQPVDVEPESHPEVHEKGGGHMPKPGGRWVGRAEKFEADNREGVRRLRLMMSGDSVSVADAAAMFPPTDNKLIMLSAWIFREGWVRESRPDGAVFRRMTAKSKQYANWRACVGRIV